MTTDSNFLGNAQDLLSDWRPEHTPIQLEHFVIGNASHDTPWGRYTQAMRELQARYEGAVQSELVSRERNLDLEEALLDLRDAEKAREHELAGLGPELTAAERPRLDIAVRRAALAVSKAESALLADARRRDTAQREAAVVLEQAAAARAEVGELTEERRLDLEWEFWAQRFLDKVVFARLYGLPIPDEIISSMRRLPDKHRAKVSYALTQDQKALEFEHAARLGLIETKAIE